MGFMDKVKSQAGALAEKAQEGAKAGQEKLSQMQAKKQADALLLELGGLVYTQQENRAGPDASQRIEAIVGELRNWEATNGPVAVTGATGAVPPASGGSVPTSYSGTAAPSPDPGAGPVTIPTSSASSDSASTIPTSSEGSLPS